METLTAGKSEKLQRELLAELADDYVGLWDVARMVAEELGVEDAAAVREGTMRLVEGMLLLGLVRPGLARDDGGFEPWPTHPRASVSALNERWDGIERPLTLGDVPWVDLTPWGEKLPRTP